MTKLSRVSYNSNGWVTPSGSAYKSTNPETHEGLYGFGYEEWLFDFSKLIDGYKYGFLQPFNNNFNAYTGNNYPNIYLYTLKYLPNLLTQRFWVAHLRNVQVLTQQQCVEAWEVYENNGWLDEMRGQLHAATGLHDFTEHHNRRIVNCRFKPEGVSIYQPLNQNRIPGNHPVSSNKHNRFQLYNANDMQLP